MTVPHCFFAVALAIAPLAAFQDEALAEQVIARVRSVLLEGAPFPPSDEPGSLPADGKSADPWIVRPHQPGDRTIEILANPLNEEYQRRAAAAMAQIERSIEAAQRRAEQQYERAIAEAKRTRRSQDVDGVSLSDEGLAGARIDAESHVSIEVRFNQPSYRWEVASSVAPAVSRQLAIGGATVIAVPANVVRDEQNVERLCEAETFVFVGRVAAPEVRRRADAAYEITAAATPPGGSARVSSLVVRLRGNEELMADLVRKGNWPALLELLD